jgi:hypothetical protein
MQKSVQEVSKRHILRHGSNLRKSLKMNRAGNRVRTDDLLITNQLLYQLSYAGFSEKNHILAVPCTICFKNATDKL